MNALFSCNCCAREQSDTDAAEFITGQKCALTDAPEPAAEEAPAEAEAEPEPAPTPLKVGFSTTDGAKEIIFTQAPLGMDFTKKDPQIVKRVHLTGHAAELGVQPGWVIVSYNGESMEGKEFEFIYHTLKAGASKLPAVAVANAPPLMQIAFCLPDKSTEQLSFFKVPLGMAFKRKDPGLVSGVAADSHAAELGVREGWVISAINGEDMTGKDFGTFFSKLQMESVEAALGLDGARILPIAFRLPDSSIKKVNFTKSPLGLEIGEEEATTIKGAAAGTQAAQMGVQVGWMITTINGEVVEGKDFDYVFEKLCLLSKGLPAA